MFHHQNLKCIWNVEVKGLTQNLLPKAQFIGFPSLSQSRSRWDLNLLFSFFQQLVLTTLRKRSVVEQSTKRSRKLATPALVIKCITKEWPKPPQLFFVPLQSWVSHTHPWMPKPRQNVYRTIFSNFTNLLWDSELRDLFPKFFWTSPLVTEHATKHLSNSYVSRLHFHVFLL